MQATTRRAHHVRKILQNLPRVRVPALRPLLPPPTAGVRVASQTNSSVIMFEAFYRATMSVRARLRTIRGAGPPRSRPLPPVPFPRTSVRPNDHPRPLTSRRLTPILPSSNSAPACTWPSSSRVLSSARRCAPPQPRPMPALPRVPPPTPVFPGSVQPGAVFFRAFPPRERARAGGTPRPPASGSPSKGVSFATPSRRVRARPPGRPPSRAIAR